MHRTPVTYGKNGMEATGHLHADEIVVRYAQLRIYNSAAYFSGHLPSIFRVIAGINSGSRAMEDKSGFNSAAKSYF
jgi:hypothetical protein